MNLRHVPNVICKQPHCGRLVQARGMCNTHYQFWRRNTSAVLVREATDEMILAAMPGTRRQLEQRTGFVQHTILIHTRRLRTEGRAHIGDNEPPPPGQAGRWSPIYTAGPGVDKKVTKAMKLARDRAIYKARVTTPRMEVEKARAKVAADIANDVQRAAPGLIFADPFGLGRRAA